MKIVSLDNLTIAKLLHDEGKPLPKETCFVANSEYLWDETLFSKALYQIFGVLCILKNGEEQAYEPVYQFGVNDPDVQVWHKLKKRARTHPKLRKEMGKDEEQLLSNVRNSHDYFDMDCHVELTSYGLVITVWGYYGTLSGFLEEIITFKRSLKSLINKWENQLEVENGVNTDRNLGGHSQTGRGKKGV